MSYDQQLAEVLAENARLSSALSEATKSKPKWYTEELEEILGLLADTLQVRRYDADALLAAAKARMASVEALTKALYGVIEGMEASGGWEGDDELFDAGVAALKAAGAWPTTLENA